MRILDIIDEFGLEDVKSGKQSMPMPDIDNMILFNMVIHPKFAKASFSEELLEQGTETHKVCSEFNDTIIQLIRKVTQKRQDEATRVKENPIDALYAKSRGNFELVQSASNNYASLKNLMQYYYTHYAMFNEWFTNSKQVYFVDKDFASELAKTEKAKIYPKLYKNIPYSTFVFSTPDESDVFFVHVDSDNDSLRISFIQFDGDRSAAGHASSMTYSMEDGDDYVEFDFTKQETINEHYLNCLSDVSIDAMLLQFCTYLISEKPDVSNRTEPIIKKIKKEGQINREVNEITASDVGYRFGSAIRLHKKKPVPLDENATEDMQVETVSQGKTRKPVSPYMRAAHWHSYWIGKKDGSEERKLIVKWLPPTYCAGILKDVVIHNVERGKAV